MGGFVTNISIDGIGDGKEPLFPIAQIKAETTVDAAALVTLAKVHDTISKLLAIGKGVAQGALTVGDIAARAAILVEVPPPLVAIALAGEAAARGAAQAFINGGTPTIPQASVQEVSAAVGAAASKAATDALAKVGVSTYNALGSAAAGTAGSVASSIVEQAAKALGS